jgi:Tfp pilus assembly protein PilV
MQRSRKLGWIVAMVALAVGVGGCFHVPARALQNGRYMSEWDVMGGGSITQQRRVQSRLNSSAFAHRAAPPYTFGGHW